MDNLIISIVLTIAAIFLLTRDDRLPSRTQLVYTVGGIVALALLCLWHGYRFAQGDKLVAVVTGMLAGGTVALFGIIQLIEANGTRRLLGLLYALLVPAALIVAFALANPAETAPARDVEGETIAQSIVQFHNDRGIYPDSLDQLIPDYLSSITDPGTQWGWLYTVQGDEFWLAYVSGFDSLGYTLCLIHTSKLSWDCSGLVNAPFQLPPEGA